MHAPGYRVCIESGFLGSNLVFSTACTSSNLVLAAALDLVRADKADVVIAGGFDPLSPISCAGFSVMRNVSRASAARSIATATDSSSARGVRC